MSEIVVTGSARATSETIDEMIEVSLVHVRRSRTEPGCLFHAVHRDVEEPLRLVFVERWATREALQAHFAVPESTEFVRGPRPARGRTAHDPGLRRVARNALTNDRRAPYAQRVRFAEVNGVRVSAIGLGTWQFGSGDWGYGSEYADNEAGRILERALDLGVNLVDTAEVYGRGASERIVGRAIANRRAEVFLATKVLPLFPIASVVESRGRKSAERLGVDQIDLYQIHWPNPTIPLGEQMRGMQRLVDAGLVAHVGVSNFARDRCDRGRAASRRSRVVEPGAVQPGVPQARRRGCPVRARQRPSRPCVQPAGEGFAVRPVRRDEPAQESRARQRPALPARERRARARPHRGVAHGRQDARREPVAGRAGVGDLPPERRRDSGRQLGRAIGEQRRRGRPRAVRRRAGAAHRGV